MDIDQPVLGGPTRRFRITGRALATLGVSLALVAAVGAGCSDDDDDSATAAFCAQAESVSDSIGELLDTPRDEVSIAGLRESVSGIQEGITELNEAGDGAKVESWERAEESFADFQTQVADAQADASKSVSDVFDAVVEALQGLRTSLAEIVADARCA